MVVEPGIAGVKDDGTFIYIDSVANISGKIKEGIYNRKIQEALHLNPLETEVEFKSAVVKKANVIKVTSEWRDGSTDLGVKVNRELIRLLSDEYERIVKQRKGDYSKQIFIKQNDIKKLEAQRTSLKGTLTNIKHRMAKLEKEVRNVKNNTEDLMKQRDILLKKDKTGVEMPLLLYSTTIQQNISYFNQMNDQIYNFREKEEKARREVKSLEEDIDTAKAEITALNASKGLISNIKVIQEPEVSLHPVKPKKTLIVLLSVIVGLFFMIFLAFFIEYIKNASRASPAGK
jgi:chromosome segregation ATPase